MRILEIHEKILSLWDRESESSEKKKGQKLEQQKLWDLFNNPTYKCLFHPDVTVDKLNAIIPMNTNPDPKASLTFIRNLVMTADNETPIKKLLSHWLAINNYLMGLGHRQDLSAGNSQL
jgi:hypothetical protein